MTASNVVKASTHTLTTCVGGGRVVYLEWVEAVCLRRTASDVVLQDRLQLGQILQQTSAVTVSRLLHGVVTVNIQKEINIYVEYHYEDGSVCVCVVCVCVCVCECVWVSVCECVWVCMFSYPEVSCFSSMSSTAAVSSWSWETTEGQQMERSTHNTFCCDLRHMSVKQLHC